jgi:pilus assembly protein Flp/PilA
MLKKVKQFIHDEEGVTAIEYGLIAALIAVVIIGSVRLVGQGVDATFAAVAAAL